MLFEDVLCSLRCSSNEKRANNVEIRFHFGADKVGKDNIQVQYCRTQDMVADALTRGPRAHRLEYLRETLRVGNIKEQSH